MTVNSSKVRSLSPGLAATGGFGLLGRTEPARALADLHLDLRIPAAGRLVIDTFACGVDVALDGAIGRGRNGSGCRGEQDRVRIGRRLGSSENGRLLVANAPVPRRDERALPHPHLGLARGLLVALVVARDPCQRQRPAVRHQPFLDVLAVGLAARHRAAAAIGYRPGMTGPVLAAEALCQLVARGGAAGPALA